MLEDDFVQIPMAMNAREFIGSFLVQKKSKYYGLMCITSLKKTLYTDKNFHLMSKLLQIYKAKDADQQMLKADFLIALLISIQRI